MPKNYLKFSRRQVLLAGACLLARPSMAQELSAEIPQLRIFDRKIAIGRQDFPAFGIEGAEALHFYKGGRFRAEVMNELSEPALLNWHGILAPQGQAGGLSQEVALQPGERRIYDFPLRQAGTHMMRADTGFQQQGLLAAPLIIRDIDDLAIGEMENVVLFQDLQFGDGQDIVAEMTGLSASGSLFSTIGLSKKPKKLLQADGRAELAGLLANAYGLDDPEVITVPDGASVRLRLINACAASHLQVDFSGLEAVLIGLDGWPVSALTVGELPLACGQRADVRVRLPRRGAFGVIGRVEGQMQAAGVILRSQGVIPQPLEITSPGPMITEFALEGRPFGIGVPPERPVDVKATFDFGGEIGKGFNINGNQAADGVILQLRQGQRVELLLRNQTGLSQAVHLQGHAFQVHGVPWSRFAGPMRDSLLVPADGQVAVQFDADNPGKWSFAATDIYRREAGLRGVIAYAE